MTIGFNDSWRDLKNELSVSRGDSATADLIIIVCHLPFSPLLWETARLICCQVATLKQNPHITLLPDKRQGLFLMVDVSINGAAMDTKIASCFIDRVEPIRDNSH